MLRTVSCQQRNALPHYASISAVCLTMAALIRRSPGRKNMMNAAAVPPMRWRTDPKSGTATATAAESDTKSAEPSAEPRREGRRLVTER